MCVYVSIHLYITMNMNNCIYTHTYSGKVVNQILYKIHHTDMPPIHKYSYTSIHKCINKTEKKKRKKKKN